MRVRKKKNLAARTERVAAYAIDNPRLWKGRWSELSGGRPIHLEIGCGKGRFAVGTALGEPSVFIVAVEMEPNVLVVAMENAAKTDADNLRFLSLDAASLDACFAPGEVARIYLNFSDPWPHSKNRRLTYETFLSSYRRVLAADGELRFKTDNRVLFDWSEREIRRCGWTIEQLSHDIHGAEPLDGGVETEYEERFMALGTPINFLSARPPETAERESAEIIETADCAELARFALRVWRARFTPVFGKKETARLIEERRSEAAFARLIADGCSCALMRLNGETAGMLVTRAEGTTLAIEELCVEGRFRGRGLGRRLLGEAERRAVGLESLTAECPTADAEGVKAALALGFAEAGENGGIVSLVRGMPQTRWKYLLMDADNTLFDFDAAEREAIRMVLAAAGLPAGDDVCALYSKLNAEQWRMLERGETTGERLRVDRFRRLVEELSSDADPVLLNDMYAKALVECSVMYKGAYEAIERLSRECAVAVITNGISHIQRGRMERSGLLPLIRGLYISGEIGAAKPLAEYFDAVCASLGITDRSQALVVGDSPTSDIAGARNAGIPCCLFDPDGKYPNSEADYTVKSYDELFRLVEIC